MATSASNRSRKDQVGLGHPRPGYSPITHRARASMAVHPGRMTPPPERPKFAAVALLVALLAVGCATHTDSDAQVMCEQIVKDRLRSPGTADFSGVSTIKTGDQRTVTGAVDSDN